MARKLVTPKPLEQQINDYLIQFDYTTEYLIWEHLNKFKGVKRFPPEGKSFIGKMTPEFQAWVNRRDSKYRELKAKGWIGYSKKYSEFDSIIIDRIRRLESCGFTILSFTNKSVIRLRSSDKMTTNSLIVSSIDSSIGNIYKSITFKPTLTIYF